jgi:hypothetical protein
MLVHLQSWIEALGTNAIFNLKDQSKGCVTDPQFLPKQEEKLRPMFLYLFLEKSSGERPDVIFVL